MSASTSTNETAARTSGETAHCDAPANPSEPVLRPGDRVGPVVVEGFLGRGAMGEVYTAQQKSVGRRVALKILSPESSQRPDRVARFLKEARTTGRLDHPNIVPVYDRGSQGQVHYLLMAWIDGEDLARTVERDGPLPEAKALRAVRHAARALGAAWDQASCLHRDVKPANLLLDRDGRVWLTDFGIGTTWDERGGLTLPGTRMGTPAYMSPEQARDPATVDVRDDMYALGATLWFLLTGRRPFAEHGAASLHQAKADGELNGLPGLEALGTLAENDAGRTFSAGTEQTIRRLVGVREDRPSTWASVLDALTP